MKTRVVTEPYEALAADRLTRLKLRDPGCRRGCGIWERRYELSSTRPCRLTAVLRQGYVVAEVVSPLMSSMIACASALDMGAWTTADLLLVPRTFAPTASTDTERTTPVKTPNAKTHIAWNVDTRLTQLAAMHGIVSLDFPLLGYPRSWLTRLPVTHPSYLPTGFLRQGRSTGTVRLSRLRAPTRSCPTWPGR